MEITYKFEPIRATRSKRGKCAVCGKRASRSRTVWQTLNPYNRDKNGKQKTREQILRELWHELDVWVKQPVTHERCES